MTDSAPPPADAVLGGDHRPAQTARRVLLSIVAVIGFLGVGGGAMGVAFQLRTRPQRTASTPPLTAVRVAAPVMGQATKAVWRFMK